MTSSSVVVVVEGGVFVVVGTVVAGTVVVDGPTDVGTVEDVPVGRGTVVVGLGGRAVVGVEIVGAGGTPELKLRWPPQAAKTRAKAPATTTRSNTCLMRMPHQTERGCPCAHQAGPPPTKPPAADAVTGSMLTNVPA